MTPLPPIDQKTHLSSSGILLYVAGLWTLSALDTSGKLLMATGVPILMVTWFRYVGHVALMTVIVLPSRGRSLFTTHSLARQLLRALLMMASSLLFFSLLARAPIAEATALNFIAPLVVLALAPWLLKEANRLHRWIGVVLGFAGMLVVVRPGGQLDTTTAMLGVVTAVTFAFFQLATRGVARDDPLTTNYYGGLVGAALLTPTLPLFWHMTDLPAWQWALLASTGVTGFLAHWLQIAGYARAPASLLAPYSYLQIVSAVAFGWFMFGQLPDATTAAGIGLICAAGLGVVLVERRMAARTRRLSADAAQHEALQGRAPNL